MSRSLQVAVLAGAVLAALPAAAQQAAAQQAAPACDVEQLQPQQLAMASIARNKVVSAASPEEGLKGVRDAFKQVFDKATAQNPLGRDYIAAQFMILAIEFGGEVQTRGNLNMPGDKNQPVDLIVAADSLLDLVVAAKPGCKEEIAQWREYKPFANRVKMAYDAMNAGQVDSAMASARRAMILSEDAAAPYDVLWRLAAKNNDEEGQIKNLRITVDKLAADTANAKARANLMFNLGRIQQGFADNATGARKMELFKGASEAYLQVVSEYPASDEAPFAINGISVAWALTNDSTDAIKALAAAKANAAKMGDVALAQAGIIATRLSRGADAAELFKAASNANPYSRDYLYNTAAALFDLRRSADMLPIVKRLVELDPSNPDNTLLFAYAYKGLADSTADAALKKTYTDSAVAYNMKADAMRTKVIYTAFERGRESTRLEGEIENRGNAPRSFTVEFEFLDSTGAVVDKKSVTVGPVASNQTGTFKIELERGGVAGVRYAPIP